MTEVDFLPERIRQQRARRRRLIRQGHLLALCILAMGALTYIRHGRIAEARAELAALDERQDNIERQVAMIGTLERQMADLLIKKRIESELGSRTDCTAVLAELCRIMPANVALRSLHLKTVQVHLKADAPPIPQPLAGHRAAPAPMSSQVKKTDRRVRLVITGMAPTDVDVANFIGQLSASCLFEDVNMGYAKNITFRDRVAREFQASCNLAR